MTLQIVSGTIIANFQRMKIWIDIDNSPHVPFFKPIIEAMKARGDEVLVTSREYAQTRELLTKAAIDFTEVGAHAGAGKIAKVLTKKSSWENPLWDPIEKL